MGSTQQILINLRWWLEVINLKILLCKWKKWWSRLPVCLFFVLWWSGKVQMIILKTTQVSNSCEFCLSVRLMRSANDFRPEYHTFWVESLQSCDFRINVVNYLCEEKDRKSISFDPYILSLNLIWFIALKNQQFHQHRILCCNLLLSIWCNWCSFTI